MNRNLSFWAIAVAIGASLDIFAVLNDIYWLEILFKPGTMLIIIAFAFLSQKQNSDGFSKIILAGLIFGMFGDIALMLRPQPFIVGLALFLVCHILYIIAFFKMNASFGTLKQSIPYLLFGGFALFFFIPYSGELFLPVSIYILVIVIMGWRALLAYASHPNKASQRLVFGSVFFMISDSFLAYNKFVEPLFAAGFWIMSTYFAAQFFIASGLFNRAEAQNIHS